jgi:predicted ATPase/DNA-binding CsgD family transcriptional regulator
MPLSRNKPIVCPVLIGRADDLTALHVLIDQAKSGRGQVALISGEAGIGKSRLVAEGKTYAAEQGFRHLQGNCFQGDISCPYAPLLDLLRTHFANQSKTEIATELRPFAREFVQLVPDLVPPLPESAPTPPLTPLEFEQEKRRLFEALTRWFTGLAAKQPVVLIIEDVHWSDDTSLEFLHYLARRCAAHQLLLLVTYRDEEVRSNLSHWLTQLDRERLAQEFRLARLTRSELEMMLRTIFALPHSMLLEILEPIYTFTDGNPFFIEEILKSLIEAGGIYYENGTWNRRPLSELHIPRSLHDAVQQRTDQLSESAMQVLRLAAIAGRRFDFALLQQLTQRDEQQLLTLIKELITAQLVVEESEERFAFRHALTREAIYTELLVRERKVLHRTVAEMMERLYITAFDVHLAELAYHFYEAGVWAKALEYAQRAGEKAQRLYDSRAAIEQYTLALDAARSLALAPPATLYRSRGQAYETLGAFEQARNDYEQALEIAQTTHDEVAEWQSLLDIGFLWAGRDYAQAGQWFRRSLDLALALANPKLQARSLNRIGNWLVNTRSAEEGLQAHLEALAIFETLQDTQGIAETFDLLGMANGIYGDTMNAVVQYERAIKLLRTLSDQQSLISSLTSRVAYASPFLAETTYSVCEQLEACARDITEAMSLARQLDSLVSQSFAEWVAGGAFASFGELGRGLARVQKSLQVATEIKHTQWMAAAYFTLGHVYMLLLEANLAVQALETGLALATDIGSALWVGYNTAYLARAYLLQGALPRAEAVLKAVMARSQQPANSAERRMSWAWGELALAGDEPEMALNIADRLLASAPGAMKSQPIPWLLKLKGEALGALGRQEEALQALEEARQGAVARHEPPLLWQLHRALGWLHRHDKQEDLAQSHFASARQGIESLASTIDDGTLHDHFLQTALSTLPKEQSVFMDRVAKQSFGGLTPREREVASHVALGKSNREIAEALVVSERTVETHISNIFLKLGFSSRAQVAAWVVEKGL